MVFGEGGGVGRSGGWRGKMVLGGGGVVNAKMRGWDYSISRKRASELVAEKRKIVY